MKLDTKQKILLMIYTEYQKDLPNMVSISCDKLNISSEIFYKAIQKLKNEGYINNIKEISADDILQYYTDDMLITRDGIEYVENKLCIEKTLSSEEKIEKLYEKTAIWGF